MPLKSLEGRSIAEFYHGHVEIAYSRCPQFRGSESFRSLRKAAERKKNHTLTVREVTLSCAVPFGLFSFCMVLNGFDRVCGEVAWSRAEPGADRIRTAPSGMGFGADPQH